MGLYLDVCTVLPKFRQLSVWLYLDVCTALPKFSLLCLLSSQNLGNFLYGYICTTGCSLNELTPNDAVRQCTGRGFANTLTIPNGVVCYNRTTEGSEAVHICDNGFQQDYAATRVCQRHGLWNGSIPQCTTDTGGQDGIRSLCS